MYWTDWGAKPCIKHATVDGFNPKIIIGTKLGWPNGLAIDKDENRLYWADAMLDRYFSPLSFSGFYRKLFFLNRSYIMPVLNKRCPIIFLKLYVVETNITAIFSPKRES